MAGLSGKGDFDPLAIVRARKALEEAGLDSDVPLERASSVTNEVWLSPKYAVRVNRHPNQRLHREAFLGPRLPADVGYPAVVAYGGTIGADWLVAERRPGGVLSRAWPTMTRDERRRAVAQLATLLRRLHDTPAPPDLPPTNCPQLLSPDTIPAVAPLLDGLDRLAELPHVDPGFVTELRAAARDLAVVIEPFRSTTLIHGDLHFENILWDGYVVTALLDFEYARPAPRDLELDVLLRFCAYPFLHVAPDYEDQTRAEDYAEIPWWLCDEYPELFEHPRCYDRVRLYCLAYDVRDLLEIPPNRPPRELPDLHAYHRLERLLRGESHVDRFAGKASSFTLTAAELLAATGSVSGAPAGTPPLAPGAADDRRASGRGGIPLARRSRSEPTGQDDDGEHQGQDPGMDAPTRVPSVTYRADDGDVVVAGASGVEHWRGGVAGGRVRAVVALPGSDLAAVLLDWAEDALPDGVMSWHPFANIVCIDPTGAVQWRAELPDGERCYMDVRVDDSTLIGDSYGRRCTLELNTGFVLSTAPLVR